MKKNQKIDKQTLGDSDLHLNPHSKTYDNKQPLVKLTNQNERTKKGVQKTQSDMHSKMKKVMARKMINTIRRPFEENYKYSNPVKRNARPRNSSTPNRENLNESFHKRISRKERESDDLNNSMLSRPKRSGFAEKRSSSLDRGDKMLVNLEDVVLEEDKIWTILESLWDGSEVERHCEEWWEVTAGSSLGKLENLFFEERPRKALRISRELEIISVAFTNMISNFVHPHQSLANNLRNLFFYVHQNLLVQIDFILNRMSEPSFDNIWVASLHNLLANKQLKTKDNTNISHSLEHFNEVIRNIVKNLCQTKPKKAFFLPLEKLLKRIDTMSVSQVRDTTYKMVFDNVYKGGQLLPSLNASNGAQLKDTEMPPVSPPFLPHLMEAQRENVYTLILDLDETLVHYYELGAEGKFLVRPGTEEFLNEMAKYYEIVIFTAATQDYADWVVDRIDPDSCISHRLYRQHAYSKDTGLVKDLSLLGRDLSKIIIIDNIAENFQNQPGNGIFIQTWFNDMEDKSLTQLIPLLREIVEKKVPDVRIALRKFRDQMLRKITTEAFENQEANNSLYVNSFMLET